MVKLGIATFIMTALLWLGISQFLGGTESFGNRVVLRAQQDPEEADRIRDQIKRRKEKKSAPAVRSNPAPQRDVSENEVLTVRSVVKRSDAALAQLQGQAVQTAPRQAELLQILPTEQTQQVQQAQLPVDAEAAPLQVLPAGSARSGDELIRPAVSDNRTTVVRQSSSANDVASSSGAQGSGAGATTTTSSALSQRSDSDADRRKVSEAVPGTTSGITVNSTLLAANRVASESSLIAQIDKDLLKRPAATRAVDLQLKLAAHCQSNRAASLPVGVMYRHESAAIKGNSLGSLDALILQYRRCRESIFIASHNPQGEVDSDELLRQLRVDELKYYLLQRSVALSSIRFAE